MTPVPSWFVGSLVSVEVVVVWPLPVSGICASSQNKGGCSSSQTAAMAQYFIYIDIVVVLVVVEREE